MRTLEQKVEHYNGLLDIAYTATKRAERKVAEVKEKKASALLYAENNVLYAAVGCEAANSKLKAAKAAVETAAMGCEAADSKLIAAKATVATTIERYDVLVANATAAHKAAVFRQSDAQDNYNFASSSVEFRDRKETLEMLRRFENERAGEQEMAKRAYLAQEAGGIATTQHKVDDRSIVKIEDAEEDECKPVRFFDTA